MQQLCHSATQRIVGRIAAQGSKVEGIRKAGTLSGNQVSDLSHLSPISNMKYLRYLNLNNNRLNDLKPLVVMSNKDFEGEKSFAPYLFLAVNGNPLNAAAKTQLAELKGYGVRLELAERVTADHKSVDGLKASAASPKKKASTQTKK